MKKLWNQHKKLTLLVFLVSVLIIGGSVYAQDHSGGSRPESDRQSPVQLDPSRGQEIGFVYEAFLSPHREGGEEEDTPATTPQQFRSTAPSVPRNERTSRGHAIIEFTKDYSKAYVYLAIENVNLDDIIMLHLHCGRPGQLGPIIIDFSLVGNINEYLADGTMSVELTNEDIEAVLEHSDMPNPVDAFTLGCPIVPSVPFDKVKTIAGMALIASEGELYFNLHTKGQTYFGDIRGHFYEIELNEE